MPRMRTRRHTLGGRARSGAALTEALVVAVVIAIFFGATWFFHDLHDRKGDTLRDARYRAWAATRFACGSGSVSGLGSGAVRVPMTMQRTGAPGSLSVQSRTQMQCNVEPDPRDTPLAAFSSFADLIDF